MSFTLTSPAFASGERIPARHAEDGEDLSPHLNLADPPAGTIEFALICDDPDAPTAEPWVHWVLYNLPGDVRELAEGLPRLERLPFGACQGCNTWSRDNLGYRGPAPPPGKPHHYHFTLYALDAKLGLAPLLDKTALKKAIAGHVLAETTLTGIYQR